MGPHNGVVAIVSAMGIIGLCSDCHRSSTADLHPPSTQCDLTMVGASIESVLAKRNKPADFYEPYDRESTKVPGAASWDDPVLCGLNFRDGIVFDVYWHYPEDRDMKSLLAESESTLGKPMYIEPSHYHEYGETYYWWNDDTTFSMMELVKRKDGQPIGRHVQGRFLSHVLQRKLVDKDEGGLSASKAGQRNR